MGSLYAMGSVSVAHDKLAGLERDLQDLCDTTGFPKRSDEFKWSPSPGSWMHSNLVAGDREAFFLAVIDLLATHEVVVGLCMVDGNRAPANWGCTPEEDVTRLFIERAENRLRSIAERGVIISDRPGGAHADDDKFLRSCAELLEAGTDYVKPKRIAINVLTTDSKMVRCLQAADLVAGASLAFISGEKTYSPTIFARLLPLYFSSSRCRGGVSIKMHPDFVFGNLYHWLFEDTHLWKKGSGHPMPIATLPYAVDADTP